MQRWKFSREFKLQAVKLVRDRGVAVAQAARDLDLHENVLRKWVREAEADPQSAFPGNGQMKPEQQEIERLRRKLARMKAARYRAIILTSLSSAADQVAVFVTFGAEQVRWRCSCYHWERSFACTSSCQPRTKLLLFHRPCEHESLAFLTADLR